MTRIAWIPQRLLHFTVLLSQSVLLLLKHLRLHCRHPNTSSLDTLACSSPNQECSLKLSIWIRGFLKWWSHVLESNPDLMDFNAQNVPDLTDTLSSRLPCLFDTFPLPFELFLIFLAPQVLYLYILCQPWDQRLLQRALVSFTGGWWLEVRPGLWFDFCSWATIVSGDFSVDRARKHAF